MITKYLWRIHQKLKILVVSGRTEPFGTFLFLYHINVSLTKTN